MRYRFFKVKKLVANVEASDEQAAMDMVDKAGISWSRVEVSLDKTYCRPVDDLWRVVIPAMLRKQIGVTSGDYLELYVENDAIIMRKILFKA